MLLKNEEFRKNTIGSLFEIAGSHLGAFRIIGRNFLFFRGLLIDSLVSLEWISTDETQGLSYGTIWAFGALIGMPVLFAAFGLITSLIGGLLFNTFSKWLGWANTNFE